MTSPMTLQVEHALIGDIYDAAMQPELWPAVLKQLSEQWPSKSVNMIFGDRLNPASQIIYTHGTSEDEKQLYIEGGFEALDMEHSIQWIQRGLSVGNTSSNDILFGGIENFKQSAGKLYSEFYAKIDILYSMGSMLELSDFRFGSIAFHRGHKSASFNQADIATVSNVIPHVRRAFQIHRQLFYVQRHNAQLYRMLDTMVAGVILLDRHGKPRYANPSAEKLLTEHRTLSLTSTQGFKANHADHNHQLQLLINGAIHTGLRKRGTITTTGGVLGLTAIGTDKTLMLTITPLSEMSGYEDLSNDGIAAAIFITDPQAKKILARRLLQQSFLLNDRECDACEAFLNAATLDGVANALGITMATTRSYIKEIYAKTNQHSQAELMKLLMGLTIDFEHIR